MPEISNSVLAEFYLIGAPHDALRRMLVDVEHAVKFGQSPDRAALLRPLPAQIEVDKGEFVFIPELPNKKLISGLQLAVLRAKAIEDGLEAPAEGWY